MVYLFKSVSSALKNFWKEMNKPINPMVTDRMFRQPGGPYYPQYGLISLQDNVPHLIDVATTLEWVPRSECLLVQEDSPEPWDSVEGMGVLDSFHNVIHEPIMPNVLCISLLFIVILVLCAWYCPPAVILGKKDEEDNTRDAGTQTTTICSHDASTQTTTIHKNSGTDFDNMKVKSSWEKSFAALSNGQDKIIGVLLSCHSDAKRRDNKDLAELKKIQEKIMDVLSTSYSGARSEDQSTRSLGTQTDTANEGSGSENEDTEIKRCNPSHCHKCPKFKGEKHHVCEPRGSESDSVAWREWQISQIISQAQQLLNAVALLPEDGMSDGETSMLDRLRNWVQEEASYTWEELTALSNRRMRSIAEQLVKSSDGIQRWQGRYNACLNAKIMLLEESRNIEIGGKGDQREVLEKVMPETVELSNTDEAENAHFGKLQARIDQALKNFLEKLHKTHCQGREHENEINKAHTRILGVRSQLSQAEHQTGFAWIEFQDFWEIKLQEAGRILAGVREHLPQCTAEDCKQSKNCGPGTAPEKIPIGIAPENLVGETGETGQQSGSSTPEPPEQKQEHWFLAQPEYDQTFPNGHETKISGTGTEAIVETIGAMHADDPHLGDFAVQLWDIATGDEFKTIPSGSQVMIDEGVFTAEQLNALLRIWGNERKRNIQLGRYVESQNEPLVARTSTNNKHDALTIWIQENIAVTDKEGRETPAQWSGMKPNAAQQEKSEENNTKVPVASGSSGGDGSRAEPVPGPSEQTVPGPEGSVQTSPPQPIPSETLTASELAWNQWNRDFPRGSRTIETSSVGLRCGIFAVLNTVHALNLGIEGLTELSLMDVVYNDPFYREQVRVFGATNKNHFSIHQLALIIRIWGFNHGIPLRLAYVAQDDVPILTPHPDPDGAIIVWVHNDNAEELNLSKFPLDTGSVPYSHYSGLRPATQAEYDDESADTAREERRKVNSVVEALPQILPICLSEHHRGELRFVDAEIRSLREAFILLPPTDERVGSSNRDLVHSLRRLKTRAHYLVESISTVQSACASANCRYRAGRTRSAPRPPSRRGTPSNRNRSRIQFQSTLSPLPETPTPSMGPYRSPLPIHTDSTKADSSSGSRISSPASPCYGLVEGVDDAVARFGGLALHSPADLARKKQTERQEREAKQADVARLAKEVADRRHAEEARFASEQEANKAAEAERQEKEQVDARIREIGALAARKAAADRKREEDGQRLAQEQSNREEVARVAARNRLQIQQEIEDEKLLSQKGAQAASAMVEALKAFQATTEPQRQSQQEQQPTHNTEYTDEDVDMLEGEREISDTISPHFNREAQDLVEREQAEREQNAKDKERAVPEVEMSDESEISDTISPRFTREAQEFWKREQAEREQNAKGKERAVPEVEMSDDDSSLSSLSSSAAAQLEVENMDTGATLSPRKPLAPVKSTEQAMTDAPLHLVQSGISEKGFAHGGLPQQHLQSQLNLPPRRPLMIRLRMGPAPQLPEVPPKALSETERSVDECEDFEDVLVDPTTGEENNTNARDHPAESQGPSNVSAGLKPSPKEIDVDKYIIEEKESERPASEASTLEIIPDIPVPESELLPVPKAPHERPTLKPLTAAERRKLREKRAETIAAKTGQSVEVARVALAKSEKEIGAARDAKRKAEQQEKARKEKEAAKKKQASANAEENRKIRKEERYNRIRADLSGPELKKALKKLSLDKRIRKKLDKIARRPNDETTSESDADDLSTPDVSQSEYPYLSDEGRFPVQGRVTWEDSSTDESTAPLPAPHSSPVYVQQKIPYFAPPPQSQAPSAPIPERFIVSAGQIQSPIFVVTDEMRRAAMQGGQNQDQAFNLNQRPNPNADMTAPQRNTVISGNLSTGDTQMRGDEPRAIEEGKDTPAQEAMKAAAEAAGPIPSLGETSSTIEQGRSEKRLFLLPPKDAAEVDEGPPLLDQITVRHDKKLESFAPRSKTGSGCQNPYCLDKRPHDCYDAFDSDEIDEDDSGNEGFIVNPRRPAKSTAAKKSVQKKTKSKKP